MGLMLYTICQRSSDPFYLVSYYIKWVTTSWTHSSTTEFENDANRPSCLKIIKFMRAYKNLIS